MQGQGRSKEAQGLVLLTASQIQVGTSSNVTAGGQLFHLGPRSQSFRPFKFGGLRRNNVEEGSVVTPTPKFRRLV